MEIVAALIVGLVLGAVLGWVGRKWAVKNYPDRAQLLDAVGTQYGKKAEEFLRSIDGR